MGPKYSNLKASINIPGVINVLKDSFERFASLYTSSPIPGKDLRISLKSFLNSCKYFVEKVRLNNEDTAPTFFAMDISLSFKITIIFLLISPAWFKPS